MGYERKQCALLEYGLSFSRVAPRLLGYVPSPLAVRLVVYHALHRALRALCA
jgi:hypothetical protein